MMLKKRTAGFRRGRRLGRRGSVALLVACSFFALLAATGAAINMAQLSAGRAALQRAVDSAALSGAAAYSANSAAFNALAIRIATIAFCNATTALPLGATVVAQGSSQGCSAGGGPVVTATTDSYIPGVPGVSESPSVSCAGTTLPAAPYLCGFIVSVSASVAMNPMLPTIFGASLTISANAMAANPFISFAQVFSIPGGVTSAKYANSVWAYPLLLNDNGGIDYSTNAGALPDTSACTGGPDQTSCGSYVMLANTIYSNAGVGYTPSGQTVIYDNGIVRNPVSPTKVTATTPLGIAFRSIAGGNYVQYSVPGVYGYQVSNFGARPPTYSYAPNGCIYPYSNLVYHTVGQVWQTVTTTSNGVTTTSYTPLLPWPLVTHWFYSSYLAQNLPPSQSLITAQDAGPQDIPSVIADTAQASGNILGWPTYNANPSPAVATSCPSTTTTGGVITSNDMYQSTTYLTSGNTNCSLYIVQAATSGSTAARYTGSCFDPAATPGQQYAAMSCQSYGSSYYTFFWNDMGGAMTDDDNYTDGTVQLSCSSSSQVVLIN